MIRTNVIDGGDKVLIRLFPDIEVSSGNGDRLDTLAFKEGYLPKDIYDNLVKLVRQEAKMETYNYLIEQPFMDRHPEVQDYIRSVRQAFVYQMPRGEKL